MEKQNCEGSLFTASSKKNLLTFYQTRDSSLLELYTILIDKETFSLLYNINSSNKRDLSYKIK